MMTVPGPVVRKRLLAGGLLVAAAVAGLLINYALAQQQPARGNSGERVMPPGAEFHMARMVYADSSGGAVGGSRNFGGSRRPGWWAIDYPAAEYHFTRGVRRLSNIEVAEDSHHIRLSDDALFDHPWLFVQQVGYWQLSGEEITRLREYLLRGGFLVVDDFHGRNEWQRFSSIIRRVFPERPIEELGTEDEVFHVLYDLDQLTQIPGERHVWGCARGENPNFRVSMEGPQDWRGIYDDDGRLMVAINYNMDMGDAWEHADDACYPQPMTTLAYRFGLNYVVYAMTH